MKKPKVTVIIPVYNAEDYIGRCLDSVLKQTYQDFLILAINDGSTDRTDEILKKYAKDFPEKIKYIKQKNMGVAKTRNKGILLAESEYITFIDNDDFIDEDYLEKLMPVRDEVDVVISGYRRKNNAGKIIKEVELEDTVWSKFIVPAPWAKIYRKDFIIKNKLEFLDNDIGEDIYFNIPAMLIARKVKILKYIGYNWFLNEKSVSNTKQKKIKNVNVMKLLNSLYNDLDRRGLIKDNQEVLELFFYRYIVWFLLYASKGQKKDEINKIYDELFAWLEKKFPDYQKNKYLKGKLAGEEKMTRVAYKTFLFAQKVGLSKSLIALCAKI